MTPVRVVAPLAALVCFAAVARPQDNLANQVTIYRDTYGIPHVFGETDAATAFGFAYAQAEDNFWRLEDNYLRKESDGHDWYNLLNGWGLLEQDTAIARWMRGIAFIVCVASIIVAVWSELQRPREEPAEALVT